MAQYWNSLKTVLGFTHVFGPLWAKYVALVAKYPTVSASAIIVLLLVAIR
jgi:hypothetical protein